MLLLCAVVLSLCLCLNKHPQLEQLDGRLQNPDQCLTTDIQKFCHSLADLYRCALLCCVVDVFVCAFVPICIYLWV
jgi:hypothetical protein